MKHPLAVLLFCLACATSPAADGTNANFKYYDSGDGIRISGFYTKPHGAVVIPSSIDGMEVTGIDDRAFFNTKAVTSVSIPATVTTIGSYAFLECGLRAINVAESNPNYSSRDGVLFNKAGDTILRYPEEKAGAYVIPDTVTTIGHHAFGGSRNLTSAIIPSSVTELPEMAFAGSSGLKSVTIPPTVTSIVKGAFSECSSLENVTIPAGVTTIAVDAFSFCKSLKNITIPAGVTRIDDYAFYECTGLTNVTIPGAVTSIGVQAFDKCSGLKSLSIPASVTSIAKDAFSRCSSLANVTIPDSLTSIAVGVFSFCKSLTNITIPSGVTIIDDYAFYGCSGLTNVTIPSAVTSIGAQAFAKCAGLTNVTIPASVTSIGDGSFYECTGLTNVTFIGGVTSIGEQAFRGCGRLINVTFPAGVTSIGEACFYECGKLVNAVFLGDAPTLGKWVFSKTSLRFEVYFSGESAGFTTPSWEGYLSSGGTPPLPVGIFSGIVGEGRIGTRDAAAMQAFFQANGFVTLTAKDDGSFTGNLRLAGASMPFKGAIGSDGNSTATIIRPAKDTLLLDFKATADRTKITCALSGGGNTTQSELLPSIYSGTKAGIHPLVGSRYTMLLPSPDATLGHGYATMAVTAKGVATIAGKLADGTGYTAGSSACDDGNGNWVVPMHIPIYKGSGGVVWGEVVVPKTAVANDPDVTGSLAWLRPADAKAKIFVDGFLKPLDPIGEEYQITQGISFLTGTVEQGAFTVTADPQARVLSARQDLTGAWSKTNAPTLTKPAKITFAPKTGLFKGTFQRTVNGKAANTPYEGVVFSHTLTLPGETTPIQAAGFFSTGTASGQVELTSP